MSAKEHTEDSSHAFSWHKNCDGVTGVSGEDSSVTSDIIADTSSETAPPRDNTPLKHLSIDEA